MRGQASSRKWIPSTVQEVGYGGSLPRVCPNSSPVFKLLTGQLWQGALKWCSQCVLINGLREEEEGEREQWRWRKGCRSLLLPSHPNSLGDRTETVPSPKTSYSARVSHSSTQ